MPLVAHPVRSLWGSQPRCARCVCEWLHRKWDGANPAHQKIKINMLINVFDQVRKDMGLKPILSAQLAKCALAYIPKLQIVNQMQDVVLLNSTLMDVV